MGDSKILLPDHAPEEYLDRQTLWESVTKVEKKSNAQFAREIEVALPVEFSRELQLAVIREYVRTNFVSEGMCADIAIHDKRNGGNHGRTFVTVICQWNSRLTTATIKGKDFPLIQPYTRDFVQGRWNKGAMCLTDISITVL